MLESFIFFLWEINEYNIGLHISQIDKLFGLREWSYVFDNIDLDIFDFRKVQKENTLLFQEEKD
jgi:hypothetical protein